MKDDNLSNIQYNSCVSRGICSVSPRTSALQTVLILYLHLIAKYCIKLISLADISAETRNFILNAVAITVANPEFTENAFENAIDGLKKILPSVINKYNEEFSKNDFEGENIYLSDIYKRCENIVDAIKLGEEISRTLSNKSSCEIRDLFKIMLVISKCMSMNLLDLESYGLDTVVGFKEVLCILSAINPEKQSIENLKSLIKKSADKNIELMNLIHAEQEKRYGVQGVAEVSYTTTAAKAVLVVGSNIRELENILEKLKDANIDVYTHDDMMLAHTFPKFKEFKNLKGQYGHGVENCLIDFAKFPGPIILTKHSLHNIDNLYRGKLFTTDINFYKGVIKIENSDFSEVVKEANLSKGFKTGKVCETVKIGYDYESLTNKIKAKLSSGQYKQIIFIGDKDFSKEQKLYFEKLTKSVGMDTLIISLSYNFNKENFVHVNTCFDTFVTLRIVEYINSFQMPVFFFLPKYSRNTMSEIIYISQITGIKVFVGDCVPIMLNPTLRETLQKVFGIRLMTNPQKDLEA